jgi:DNA-binding beta-propeller fold protein YncE
MHTNTLRSTRAIAWRTGRWLCGLWLAGCSANSSKPAANPEPTRAVGEVTAPAISVAAHDSAIRAPFDATPSPKGERVYYTALKRGDDGEDVPGVFSVAADGSGAIETLSAGAPLTAPVGISVSLDGSQLFVADTATGSSSRGAILTLPSAGGSASPLAGTEGYAPAGLAIAKVKDQAYLYFSGRDPESAAAGLFRVAASGGVAEPVAAGGGFDDPSGVAISAQGDAYVVDAAADQHAARVLRVHDGKVESFVAELGIGFPAGITLSRDERTLLVSGVDPTSKHDVVYYVDVASRKLSRLTKTVGAFAEAAGLHRAHEADVFAWADSQADSSGTVYVLKP